MQDNEKCYCYHCDCYDFDEGYCTMPTIDKVYACPIYTAKYAEEDDFDF